MCGRYANGRTDEDLVAFFDATPLGDLAEPSWNIKPTQDIDVVRIEDGKRVLQVAHWSLIPPWNKDGKPKFTFNARSEEASSKATWKSAVKGKRCLIPADGYYEWSGPKNARIPHYIHADEPLAFAGLFGWWRASDNDPWKLTATILTMPAVPELSSIHDRNPVALPEDWWADWLDPELEGDQNFVDAAAAAAAPLMSSLEECTVKPLRGDGPELIEPA